MPPKKSSAVAERGVSSPPKKSSVVKLSCIPYGFFEKELLGFFSQFGTVVRIRVARSKKTGNHKGWAYVSFTDSTVAQLAAEAMHGYLMFEKRVKCAVLDEERVPEIMKKGRRVVAQPHTYGRRLKHCLEMNKDAKVAAVAKAAKKQKKRLTNRLKALEEQGVEYTLPGARPAATGGAEELEITTEKQNEDAPPEAKKKKKKVSTPIRKTPQQKTPVGKTPPLKLRLRSAKK